MNELEELRHDTYDNSRIFKEKTKRFHDQKVLRKFLSLDKKFYYMIQGSIYSLKNLNQDGLVCLKSIKSFRIEQWN